MAMSAILILSGLAIAIDSGVPSSGLDISSISKAQD
jgi:hypothetical protein